MQTFELKTVEDNSVVLGTTDVDGYSLFLSTPDDSPNNIRFVAVAPEDENNVGCDIPKELVPELIKHLQDWFDGNTAF